MSVFLGEVSDQLNLRWAWDKVRREATPGDIWFDEIELAGFDLNLEANLESIADELRTGRYRLAPIRPLPFPKHPGKDGIPRVRQAFQVAVRDQVAWTAMVNVIGPHIDSKMPPWSYGNRLFRSIWVEEEGGIKYRRIGRYRHSSGRLYLGFGQSWPVFRRHVYLATRAMIGSDVDLPEMDERTEEESELQARLASEYRCQFVNRQYWASKRPSVGEPELYWCSVDLERFYPTMNLRAVRKNIVDNLPSIWIDEANRLLTSMLRFPIDTAEWSEEDLMAMDVGVGQRKTFQHIPTGLYVAGFLANAGLLAVDLEVQKRLPRRKVAHFRFVDDHVALAYSLSELTAWVGEYAELLRASGTGARINQSKVEPPELAKVLRPNKRTRNTSAYVTLRKAAMSACRLDPQFPSPLMTKTLAIVSGIARTDFNLLESVELAALTDQLEHLLLVDLKEDEIPKKTRLSFAATRLTRIVECRLANDETLARLRCREEQLTMGLADEKPTAGARKRTERELNDLRTKLRRQESQLKQEVSRAFQLLRKVLRERPDRIRLWTRAVLMCRLTGVAGIADLVNDINRERKQNPLASEYLEANLFGLLGSQALVAARQMNDATAARWRKRAALAFLRDVQKTRLPRPQRKSARWFLRKSWRCYCLGLYAATIVLKTAPRESTWGRMISFPSNLVKVGKSCATDGHGEHPAGSWAWWAARTALRDLSPRADPLVSTLGRPLPPSSEARAYWRFFPLDVPATQLGQMIPPARQSRDGEKLDGWWIDALRERKELATVLAIGRREP